MTDGGAADDEGSANAAGEVIAAFEKSAGDTPANNPEANQADANLAPGRVTSLRCHSPTYSRSC